MIGNKSLKSTFKGFLKFADLFDKLKNDFLLFSYIESKEEFLFYIKEILAYILNNRITETEKTHKKILDYENFGVIFILSNGEIIGSIGSEELGIILLNIVKIDTPSTSRHQYGNIYSINNELFIDLNFQIRLLPPKCF